LATTAGDVGSRRGVAAFAGFSEQVKTAWDESFMAGFPPHVTDALLDGACETKVRGGDVFYRGSEHVETAVLALIVDGLVRTHIRSESGRQITLRYAWPGDIIGTPALVMAGVGGDRGSDHWELYGGHRLHAEALRDTLLLKLAPAQFLHLAQTQAAVASALVTCLAHLTVETEQLLEDGLFLSIRARVARHLLDLAVCRDGKLVVAEGHREIADAIGSVREVVSRTLVRLREEGVVDRRDGETILLNPSALHAIAAAG
jgi:CRP/FNR family transcriptional regulator, cyclic AMP receptor protein